VVEPSVRLVFHEAARLRVLLPIRSRSPRLEAGRARGNKRSAAHAEISGWAVVAAGTAWNRMGLAQRVRAPPRANRLEVQYVAGM